MPTKQLYLNNENMKRLDELIKGKPRGELGRVVMAGVGALSGSPKWFKLFMLSEIVPIDSEKTAFTLYVLAEGHRIERSMNFEVVSYYDAHQVIATRRHMGKREEVELYAGTRHNCELVAEHLNKILREAEEKQS